MNSEQVCEIARAAVAKLVAENGDDFVFPFDMIWRYADTEVPSLQRPGPRRRLVKDGYIEQTGDMLNAFSASRAGSPTPAYRPGPFFRPQIPRIEVQAGLTRAVPARSAQTNAAQSMSDILRTMETAMAARGFLTTAVQLANFYLALQTSPLVILTGISGSGKSWLPRLFAELIGAEFITIPVEPQWSDNSYLFGYTSNLAPDKFVMEPFTAALLDASKRPDKLFIVRLDEMNLAPVEHYFSHFISVVESRKRIPAGVVTDTLPLDLPRLPEDGPDFYQSLRKLQLPSNVRVVGTANMDETTRQFSPKVLDRAISIEFDEVDLTAFPEESDAQVDTAQFRHVAARLLDPLNPLGVGEVYRDSQELFDRVSEELQEIRDMLKPAGFTYAYRPRDQICLYMWHWQRDSLQEIMPPNAAFDFCVSQKVLPKLAGSSEALRQSLETLEKRLSVNDVAGTHRVPANPGSELQPVSLLPCRRSADKVARMLKRLQFDSATTYWNS